MTSQNGMPDPRALEARVNEARKRGDIRALLEAATAAMDELEAIAGPGHGSLHQDQVNALKAARRIGYNAAADVWPGWEIDTPPRSGADLQAAQSLARRSSALTDRLGQGPIPRGNSVWLIGAFHLARRMPKEAFAAFREAAALYADAPAAKLLSEGYMAIAAESGGNTSDETPPAFTAVLAKLDALASDDAMEFRT
jgi:hypothetical protein